MVQSVSPAWIAEVNSGVVDNYIAGATFVLIVYEYFITFGAEVELFWRKKITGSSVLFFPNRYLVLLYQLFQLRKQWTFSDLSLRPVLYYNSSQAIIILCYVPWGSFSALRVFALASTKRNKVLASSTVFLLSMGPVITNFATFRWFSVVSNPRGDCIQVNNLPVALAMSVSLIAADLMVIAATWFPDSNHFEEDLKDEANEVSEESKPGGLAVS